MLWLIGVCTSLILTLQDGVSGGVGVDRRHVYGRVIGLCHASEDQAVHAVQQGVGVGVAAVQQVVDVVRVVRREVVRVLLSAGQLAVVAEVVQVLVVLLYGPRGGETGAGTVVLSDEMNGKKEERRGIGRKKESGAGEKKKK